MTDGGPTLVGAIVHVFRFGWLRCRHLARQPNFRETVGSMTVGRWPRMTEHRPIMLHVSALGLFHYGAVVASNRHSQIGSVSSVAGRLTISARPCGSRKRSSVGSGSRRWSLS